MKVLRNIWRSMTPGWLQVGDGELVMYLLGLVKDAMTERARQTALVSLPTTAPEDALDLIGHDRAILRGPFEASDSYRSRLRAWRFPLGHRIRGSARALLEQVRFAFRGTEWTTIDVRGQRWQYGADLPTRDVTWNWDSQPLTPNWGKFWVIVKANTTPPDTFSDTETETFDDESAEAFGGPGSTVAEYQAVKTIASNDSLGWTPAGRQAVTLVVYWPGQPFPVPGGNWDHWPNRDPQYEYEPLSLGIE